MSIKNLVIKLADGQTGLINLRQISNLYLNDKKIRISYSSGILDYDVLSYRDNLSASRDFDKIVKTIPHIVLTPEDWQ